MFFGEDGGDCNGDGEGKIKIKQCKSWGHMQENIKEINGNSIYSHKI